ncbi:MAG TPA: isoprenylcysteine carboxylmethyltransferase family protein [Xanthobacteraceae bacterium]|jgi:methyltransferase|nr:isoprenylcysteine carboxylmethyltransferase family protein [Xanthobacteraceae bacterium]
MDPASVILGLVTAQRVGELLLSARNARRLIADGAVEAAPGHYPVMVVLHAAWLVGLWIEARGWPDAVLFTAYLGVQVLRVWVLASLGTRWTTRIIVQPGWSLVNKGPYRYLAHPNYLVVVLEIALLPLMFGLIWYAAVFSILNAALLAVRIHAENEALGRSTSLAHRSEVR